MWSRMNLPNKLTLIRMALVPVFLLLFYAPVAAGKYLALVVFIAASLTDFADGYIARRDHLITDFGKFMDPLADKLLVASALIALVDADRIAGWIVCILIGREFVISGFRLVAADKGVVIAAGWWGKIKTVVQMIMIIVLLLGVRSWANLEKVLIIASVILTLISLVDYVFRNRNILAEPKEPEDV